MARIMHHEHVSRASGARTRVVERPPWSPAQAVALVGGLVLVVIGGVALARTGINFNNVPTTRATAVGLPYTSMSALIQLVAGVILLGGGAHPDTAKATMSLFGVVLLAFGIIVAIDSTPFFNMWGYDSASGQFMAVVGAILLVAAAVSPIFFSERVDRRAGAVATDIPADGTQLPPEV